jgi:hypothetical protein
MKNSIFPPKRWEYTKNIIMPREQATWFTSFFFDLEHTLFDRIFILLFYAEIDIG